MITGIHALLYSEDPDATRAFFRDTLKLPSVDAGHGWLIFALPPAELGIHPADGEQPKELYLMCDNLDETLGTLATQGVEVTRPVSEQRWGKSTTIRIPGPVLGLYEARHPTALALAAEQAANYRPPTPERA
jgi:catechol 2,3-dioxygenase-like lactoylglutathione lyase family enzyme